MKYSLGEVLALAFAIAAIAATWSYAFGHNAGYAQGYQAAVRHVLMEGRP